MQEAVYHQYAQTLDTHWWSDHRRAIFARWLGELGIAPDGSREVLEIGCGAGTDHDFLSRFGSVTGIEINPTGLDYCRTRGYRQLIAADLNSVELPTERFDLAVDFHVLYHSWVRSPADVLRRMRDALRPGGRLIVSEPAYMLLRRAHDDVVMAARRWTRRALLDLITSSGFEVERCSGFLTLITPVVLLSALKDRLQPHTQDIGELHPPGPVLDRALRTVMALERAIMRVHPLPVGTSWALVARRI